MSRAFPSPAASALPGPPSPPQACALTRVDYRVIPDRAPPVDDSPAPEQPLQSGLIYYQFSDCPLPPVVLRALTAATAGPPGKPALLVDVTPDNRLESTCSAPPYEVLQSKIVPADSRDFHLLVDLAEAAEPPGETTKKPPLNYFNYDFSKHRQPDGTFLDVPAPVRHPDPRKNFYSWQEIRRHCKAHDCWLVAKGKVYDCTPFLPLHPAGPSAILRHAGTDATVHFDFHSSRAQKIWSSYEIGRVQGFSTGLCKIM